MSEDPFIWGETRALLVSGDGTQHEVELIDMDVRLTDEADHAEGKVGLVPGALYAVERKLRRKPSTRPYGKALRERTKKLDRRIPKKDERAWVGLDVAREGTITVTSVNTRWVWTWFVLHPYERAVDRAWADLRMRQDLSRSWWGSLWRLMKAEFVLGWKTHAR